MPAKVLMTRWVRIEVVEERLRAEVVGSWGALLG